MSVGEERAHSLLVREVLIVFQDPVPAAEFLRLVRCGTVAAGVADFILWRSRSFRRVDRQNESLYRQRLPFSEVALGLLALLLWL
jgi:hypothetical protein